MKILFLHKLSFVILKHARIQIIRYMTPEITPYLSIMFSVVLVLAPEEIDVRTLIIEFFSFIFLCPDCVFHKVWAFCFPNSQNATAEAAATLSESTPRAIGIFTT